MKKNLEKIFASCSIVVALILIMVLVVAAFGGIKTDEFDSKLVRGLIITLAILYALLAVVSLVLVFINNDVVKDITLRQEKGGSVKVTSKVIAKLVKQTSKQIEGVKCQKVTLVNDEYGVRLKVNVKVVDKDVVEAETYLRTLLEDMFAGEFGFRFSSIEIKVMALTPKYKADEANIQAKVEAKLAQLRAENGEENTENTENAENVENVDEATENVTDDAPQTEEVAVDEEQVSSDDEQAQDEQSEEQADEQGDEENVDETEE